MINRNVENTLSQLGIKRQAQREYIPAILGASFGGVKYVDVPNRPGYVFARIRNNTSEIVHVYNDAVVPAYGLQVLIERDAVVKSRYKVVAKDFGAYPDGWGNSSPYYSLHASSHEFNPDDPGGDIVWVYPQQFLPLLAFPGSSSGTVDIYPYAYSYLGNWYYVGGTGTSSLLPYNPTGTASNKIVLLYNDTNGNPQLLAGNEFQASYTGSAQITSYIPDAPSDCLFPIAAVRLTSSTTSIAWSNLYDIRPFFGGSNISSISTTGTVLYLDDLVDVNATPAYIGNVIQMVSGTWVSKVPGIPAYNVGYADGWTGSYSNFALDLLDITDSNYLEILSTGTVTLQTYGGSSIKWWQCTSGTYKTVDLSATPDLEGSATTIDYDHTFIGGFTPYFNGHFEGEYNFSESGTYTIYVTLTGGTRLWLDNQLVIDDWTPADEDVSHEVSYVFTGTSAAYRTIDLEYFSINSWAHVILEFVTPSVARSTYLESRRYASYGFATMTNPFIPPEGGGGYSIPYIATWDSVLSTGTSVLLYSVNESVYLSYGETFYSNDNTLTMRYYLYTSRPARTPSLTSLYVTMPGGVVPKSSGSSIIDFSPVMPSLGDALIYDGTYWSPGTVSGGPGGGGGADLLIYDDNTFIVTGTAIHFNNNLDVIASGTSVWVDGQGVPTGTYSLAGHIHDDRYYTETELQTSGSAQVNWGNITNAPALASKRIVQFAIAGTLQTYTGALRTTNIFGQTMIIEEVHASVNSAAFGTGICVDIHKNGTTIFTDQSHRPYITTGSFSGYSTGIDVPSWLNNEYLTMNVDLIGSTTPGSDLVVEVLFSQ